MVSGIFILINCSRSLLVPLSIALCLTIHLPRLLSYTSPDFEFGFHPSVSMNDLTFARLSRHLSTLTVCLLSLKASGIFILINCSRSLLVPLSIALCLTIHLPRLLSYTSPDFEFGFHPSVSMNDLTFARLSRHLSTLTVCLLSLKVSGISILINCSHSLLVPLSKPLYLTIQFPGFFHTHYQISNFAFSLSSQLTT